MSDKFMPNLKLSCPSWLKSGRNILVVLGLVLARTEGSRILFALDYLPVLSFTVYWHMTNVSHTAGI